jgi:hypothetical protein
MAPSVIHAELRHRAQRPDVEMMAELRPALVYQRFMASLTLDRAGHVNAKGRGNLPGWRRRERVRPSSSSRASPSASNEPSPPRWSAWLTSSDTTGSAEPQRAAPAASAPRQRDDEAAHDGCLGTSRLPDSQRGDANSIALALSTGCDPETSFCWREGVDIGQSKGVSKDGLPARRRQSTVADQVVSRDG